MEESERLKSLPSPADFCTLSLDGKRFAISLPEDKGWDVIHFHGTFETGTLDFLKKVVRSDDIVIDIGANIGWYTVHLASLVPHGHVHAFEPVPNIFHKANNNCLLNNLGKNITLNNTALGNQFGYIELHTFPDLPHGHTSMSTLGKDEFVTTNAPLITLDSYVAEHALTKIDIIKMDVEGGEKYVFEGAPELLQREDPPIWIIEMNTETSGSLGYEPSLLLDILQQYGEYDFYRIVRAWENLLPMTSISDYENGDNAVCIPTSKRNRLQQ